MSNDKRSVNTDALETLGMIHTQQEHRDAIHLAVEPVVAGQRLKAGDHVNFLYGKAYKVPHTDSRALGIVDPFLTVPVKEGDKFWLVVYPRKITSLRHVWSHPSFPEEIVETKLTVLDPAEHMRLLKQAIYNEVKAQEDSNTKAIKTKAYDWIIRYANSHSLDVETLINYGISWRGGSGDHLVDGGNLEGESVSDEFWNQLELYTGIPISEDNRGNFFSCSC
jgi:hypothetical protein